MAALNQQAYADRDGRFYPKLCGDCKFWLGYNERNSRGAKGYCVKLEGTSYRTDWCFLPEEIKRHEEAMAVYQPQEARKCKQAS